MEPRFENRYTRTYAIIKEFYKYSLFQNKRRRAGIILSAFAILLGLYYYISFADKPFYGTFYLCVILVSVCILTALVTRYILTPKIYIKRDMELNNGVLQEITMTITDTTVKQSTPCSEITLPLTKLKKVSKTKNTILLMTATNLYFILKRDSFTLGTEEEFLTFLREKGFKV